MNVYSDEEFKSLYLNNEAKHDKCCTLHTVGVNSVGFLMFVFIILVMFQMVSMLQSCKYAGYGMHDGVASLQGRDSNAVLEDLLESVGDDISEEGHVNGTSVILTRMKNVSFLRKTTKSVSLS